MNLPKKFPAGGETASAVADAGEAVANNSNGAPMILASDASHPSSGDEATPENSQGPSRLALMRFVLEGVSRLRDVPRTIDVTPTSPDAPGQKTMNKRHPLKPAAVIAGAGVMAFTLHACGGKPAPAEEAAAAEATADTSASQAMRVTRIEARNLADEVLATGRLVVREEAAVGSELSGYRVSAVYVDEGDWVKQGQPMARLDDALLQAQIAQAEATLKTQKASWDFKKSQLARAESLTIEGAFSKELLEQRRMEAASAEAGYIASEAGVNEMKVRQSRMVLRAPVSGVVLQRTLRPGDIASVASGSPYFRIARDGLIELDAELPDAKISLINKDTRATVILGSGQTMTGKVRFISPRVDQNTSLGRARIELPFDLSLRPGSFAEAHFETASTGVLSVPAGAIRYEAGGASVMLVDDQNRVKQVPVKLGQRAGDYVQLIDGPPAGSRVLATGSAFTLDGDVIKPVEQADAAAAPGDK